MRVACGVCRCIDDGPTQPTILILRYALFVTRVRRLSAESKHSLSERNLRRSLVAPSTASANPDRLDSNRLEENAPMLATRRLSALWAIWLFWLATGVAHAAPESGWWWNPQQGGRGFSIEIQGDTLFMAGYLYESDGRATWLASSGLLQTATFYQGRFQAFSNGQALVGNYQAPTGPTDAGAVSVQFTDDTHATLTWPGGTIPIERYRFSSAPEPILQPQTGWWWNPNESGRGFFIEVQGDQMFAAGYMYDAAGNPIWYASGGAMASLGTYQGRWDQYANGQTINGSYRPPSAPTNVGSVVAEFTAEDRATLTLSDSPGAVGAAPLAQPKITPKMIEVERYGYGRVPHLARSKFWKGKFDYKLVNFAHGIVGENTFTVKSNNLVWIDKTKIEGELPFLPPRDGSTDYQISSGDITVTYTGSQNTAGLCTTCCGRTDITGTTAKKTLVPSDGSLNLDINGKYRGKLFFPVKLDIVLNGPCNVTNTQTTINLLVITNGSMVYLTMAGQISDAIPIPGQHTVANWDYKGADL